MKYFQLHQKASVLGLIVGLLLSFRNLKSKREILKEELLFYLITFFVHLIKQNILFLISGTNSVFLNEIGSQVLQL